MYFLKAESSSPEMEIAEMQIDDYIKVFNLWDGMPGIGINEADSRENIGRFLNRNKGLSFCCRIDKKIAGTVLCGHDGRRGYIYHVAVAEGWRGRGIGKMLVNRSLDKLKAAGIHKCHLFVFADNVTGNSFWSSNGWTKRNDIVVYSKSVK